MNVVEASGLCFNYGAEPLMENVSFAVEKADFIAMIGSNGAGKSTLLRLLLGELEPKSGGIRLFGQDIRGFKDWPRVAYVPQLSPASGVGFPATAFEVVCSALYAKAEPLGGFFKKPLGRKFREEAKRALGLVGIWDLADRMLSELSGGQRQRVMVARALAAGCELMLLDEPATGIDSAATDSLYELLGALSGQGMTILMATHDMAGACSVVNRTFCLEEGTLVELSRDEIERELLHKHKHK